jgi:hypothetical protein
MRAVKENTPPRWGRAGWAVWCHSIIVKTESIYLLFELIRIYGFFVYEPTNGLKRGGLYYVLYLRLFARRYARRMRKNAP